MSEDTRIKISEMPVISTTTDAHALGIDAMGENVKIPIAMITNGLASSQSVNSAISSRLFVNVDSLLGNTASKTISSVLTILASSGYAAIRQKCVVLTFSGTNGTEPWQWNGADWSTLANWQPYRYTYQLVDSDEELEQLAESGLADPTTIYYTIEE